MVKETEYYELLNVAVDAEEGEIRRSYRRLALRYHPDKNPGDAEAAETFKKISHAYDVLSDAEKRALYDQHGKEGLEGGGGGGGGFDADDIFSMFFGGGRRPRGEPKPKDIVHELTVSLEDCFLGRTRRVQVPRQRLCGECSGSGMKAGAARVTCADCGGRGVQMQHQRLYGNMYQQTMVNCAACGGSGQAVRRADLCPSCRGDRVVREKAVLEVVIERGARHSDVVTFVGEGNQVPDVRLSGDVLIFLAVSKHRTFRRVGAHLWHQATLPLAEALCGTEISLRALDGRELRLTTSPGQVLCPGFCYRVHGEGMPAKGMGGMRGDLFLTVEVIWPATLPKAKLDAIAAAFGEPEKPPRVGGQVVQLTPFKKNDKKREANIRAQRRGAGKPAARAPKRKQRAREGWNFMYDDDDDDDDDDDEFETDSDDDDYGGHNGGGFYFQSMDGGPQQAQCQQQ